MSDRKRDVHAAFRLNFEQQKHRAKDLLKAARSADAASLDRIARVIKHTPGHAEIKLAHAQLAIARELGFDAWADLKAHIASMDAARDAMTANIGSLDADSKTLHLRCGSDIRAGLHAAGFRGDFLEVSYPYCFGPVTTRPDRFELEARFIAASAGRTMGVSFEGALQRRRQEEADLAASADAYERIVLWMEHDCFDQLVLVRCLAHYANTPPRILELINVNRFPGSIRFIGLGQLPPEALRMLWRRRQPVTHEQLRLAAHTWQALTAENPTRLAAIMRSGTPALPDLGIALARLLRELPATGNGLGMTERLILEVLSEGRESLSLLFGRLNYERDPLPFATDLALLQMIERLQSGPSPLVERNGSGSSREWDDVLAITETGRAVLDGRIDWLTLSRSERWVGGVRIDPPTPCWRWDESRLDVTDPAAASTP